MIGPIAVCNLGNGERLRDSLVRIGASCRVITGQTHARCTNFAIRIGQAAKDDGANLFLHLMRISAISSNTKCTNGVPLSVEGYL